MDPRIKYALEVLEKDYGNELRLQGISSEVNLSQSRFEHLFSQELGQPYKKYLKNLRLQKAQELLRDWRLRISEIAYRVGYANPSNFSRDFKKVYQYAPLEYRKKFR